MNLIDALSQTRVAIADARIMYRHQQALKREKLATQEEVNEASDDLDQLVRYFNELKLRAEALIEHVEFPDITEEEAVQRTIDRLYERLFADGEDGE